MRHPNRGAFNTRGWKETELRHDMKKLKKHQQNYLEQKKLSRTGPHGRSRSTMGDFPSSGVSLGDLHGPENHVFLKKPRLLQAQVTRFSGVQVNRLPKDSSI